MGIIMYKNMTYTGDELVDIIIPNISTNSSSYSSPLKISNGIISGFTTQYNYFRPLDKDGNILHVDFSKPFEIKVVFKVTELKNQAQVLFGGEQSYYHTPSIEIAANNNAIWCGLSTSGTTWDYYLDFLPTVMEGNTIPLNSEVTVDAIWDGTDYTVTVSYNGNSYTMSVTPASLPYSSENYNLEFGGINKSSNHYATYTNIDLAQTFIKSEGRMIWGYEKKKKNYNINIIADWDFKNSLVDNVNGFTAILRNSSTRDSSGIHITDSDQGIEIPSELYTLDTIYEIRFGTMSKQFDDSVHGRIITYLPWINQEQTEITDTGFIFHKQTQKWGVWDKTNSWRDTDISDVDYFSNSILKIKVDVNGLWHIYKNNVLIFEPQYAMPLGAKLFALGGLTINGIGDQSFYNMTIEGLKIYRENGDSNGDYNT